MSKTGIAAVTFYYTFFVATNLYLSLSLSNDTVIHRLVWQWQTITDNTADSLQCTNF